MQLGPPAGPGLASSVRGGGAPLGRRIAAAAVGWVVLACLGAPGARAETLELVPDEQAGWSLRNVFAFLRPGHFYGPRRLEVETTPPGATLDVFYIRSGFQKRYEQATAPVILILPKRIQASSRDSVSVRATADGFRQQTVRVPVSSSQDRLLIELAPLPNTLRAVAHTYFSGRASLGFLLDESPTIRVQQKDRGFSVILAETARAPELGEALQGIGSPLVAGVDAQQLGEDLLVEVDWGPAAANGGSVELRSRQHHDHVRDLYRFSIDLVPADRGAAAVEQARRALGRIAPSDVTGCAAVFDAALRAALDPAALARALRPAGSFTDPYLRAALRRLGEVAPGGRIRLADGSIYRPEVPLELAAAASQAALAEGYLALLRRFVEELEPARHRAETLRSLIAPELAPRRFADALAAAEAAEQRCRGGGAHAALR